MKACNPHVDVSRLRTQDIPICAHAPICQRCGNCIAHCVCPPPELRAQTDDFKRAGKHGGLVLR